MSLFPGAIQDPQGDFEKHSIFKPVSKAAKVRQTAPKGFLKTPKLDLRIKKEFFAKTWFSQYIQHDNLAFKTSDCQDFDQESTQKVTKKQAWKKRNYIYLNP